MLVFELVMGYPPFYDDDKVTMYKNITELRYHCPRQMSKVGHASPDKGRQHYQRRRRSSLLLLMSGADDSAAAAVIWRDRLRKQQQPGGTCASSVADLAMRRKMMGSPCSHEASKGSKPPSRRLQGRRC